MDTWADFMKFYRSLTRFHSSQKLMYNQIAVDSQFLNFTLRPYQKDAVSWMLYRERASDIYSRNRTAEDKPVNYTHGGILADEMGLGKTVEVLALILNNPCDYQRPCGSTPSQVTSDDSSDVTMTNRSLSLDNEGTLCPTESSPTEAQERRSQRKQNKISFTKEEGDHFDDEEEERPRKRRKVSKGKRCESDEDYAPPSTSRQSPKQKETSDSEEGTSRRANKRRSSKRTSYILDTKRKEKFKLGSGELRKTLNEWYETTLERMRAVKCFANPDSDSEDDEMPIKCHCNKYRADVLIRCQICGCFQHHDCVGLDVYKPYHYYCPHCWYEKPKIPTGATLIVSPDAIVHQWHDEIKRHVNKPGLKVLYYYGAKSGQYFQPEYLADQDIIITTYQSLANELAYTETAKPRSLRHRKKYYSLMTPLTCLKWYRIVLDEAQMAESVKTKTSEMIQKFQSTMKWAVTGTPIQKSFSDLYGLMVFLGVTPLNDVSEWNRLMGDRRTNMHLLLPIIWRNSKDDVLSQLNVPERHIVNHILRFSPTENYFYQRIFKECHATFSSRTSEISDWSKSLNRLDRRVVNRILQPLLQVRQACTHPQVVGGKFKHLKRTMTMEELLNAMVKKVQGDIDVAVRTWVSSLNGQAGLNILEGSIHMALEMYKSALSIPSDFPDGLIKIDILQKIHTLHNLSFLRPFTEEELCSEKQFDRYAAEALALEREYLKKYESLLVREQENLLKLESAVLTLSDGLGVIYTKWWHQVIQSDSTNSVQLIEKIKCHVFGINLSKFQIKKSYSAKIKNVHTLVYEIEDWLQKTHSKRSEVYSRFDTVKSSNTEVFASIVYDCHLNPLKTARKDKSKLQCELCILKGLLEDYEVNLFEVPKLQEDRKRNSKCIQDVVSIGDSSDNRIVCELQDVTLFRTKKEGNWMPGQMERILNVLVSYAKHTNIDQRLINEGTRHLQVLESIRKEFKSLRAVWSLLNDQVAANDELTMAKLRFEYEDESNGQVCKRLTESNIVQRSQAMSKLVDLNQEAHRGHSEVSRSVGIIQYLMNLQKNPHAERDPCPVCREPIVDKWSVLQCGHCYCFDCIQKMLSISNCNGIECAVCRKTTNKVDIAFVDCTETEPVEGDIVVRGSFSTKVEAVVLETLRIRNQAPEEKILIFSTWDKMLDLIGEAFIQNGIVYKRLGPNKTRSQKAIDAFKCIADVTALLLPIQRGSKGLNLTEATHVFFVEPILNPADETQAIGRVHRMGQTKETFVHRFIITNTIEERMLSALDTNNCSEVNIIRLHQLFSNPGAGASGSSS